MFSRFAAGSLVVLFAIGIRAADPTPPTPAKPLTPAEVESLIGQLGDEDFKTREAATAALKRRPEAALALLRANRAADNPEVKQRLATIVPVMMSRPAAEKRLAKLPDYIKNRQIDRVVETMVACRQFVTTKHRDQVLGLANDLAAAATKHAKKEMRFSRLQPHEEFFIQDGSTEDCANLTTSIVRRSAGSGGSRLVIAADHFENLDYSGISSGGIMIGNGELKIDNPSGPNLFITTGNVSGVDIYRCVILCGGNLRLRLGLHDSVVFAGGRIEVFEEWSEKNVRREGDKEVIGTWKLYSVAEAGATLRSLFGAVWVPAVAPDTPFAKAGIKTGDFLVGIDGSPVRTVRDANRLLCRATVAWGAADLYVVRDGAKKDVIVPLHEW